MGWFEKSGTTLKRGFLEEAGNDISLHSSKEKHIDNKGGEYLFLNIFEEKNIQKLLYETREDKVSDQSKRNTVLK